MIDEIIGNPIEIIDVESKEEWQYIHPKMGDHIRVQRAGIYSHHGVYVSDEEVIHFTGQDSDSILDWSKCEVIKTNLDTFLKGGMVEVKIYNDEELQDLYPVDGIVNYARACLGDKGYNLAFNNCEHFANVCTLGRFRSRQVERVLQGKLPLEEDKGMGLLGKIGGAIKSLFGGGSSGGGGSRSTSTTTYEPDKVKVAEIEADTKIRLANKEIERIEIMKQARLDILEYETQSQIALEEARARGLTVMAQTILTLQDKLNEVAEKRLLIIEKGSLQVIKDIEMFYDELSTKIQEDDDKYNTEKLPEMLEILEKYEEGTTAHKLYSKRVEEDMALQAQHYVKQIDAIATRQTQVIDGFLSSKEKILEQTGNITAGMLETIQAQTLALNGSNVAGENSANELPMNEQLALPTSEA